jgi:hypothetical protein
MAGLPPVMCARVTDKHSDPPGGITSGSWLPLVVPPLVLTVKGLVVWVPLGPKVVDHVVPAFGMVATKPAQLAVADTPALTVTELLTLPVPPIQYIVKSQTPPATV